MPRKNIKNNLFDIIDLSDLPNDVQKNVKIKSDLLVQSILKIFKMKSSLCISEILVALYREFKIKRTRAAVGLALHKLIKQNLIEKDRKISAQYHLL